MGVGFLVMGFTGVDGGNPIFSLSYTQGDGLLFVKKTKRLCGIERFKYFIRVNDVWHLIAKEKLDRFLQIHFNPYCKLHSMFGSYIEAWHETAVRSGNELDFGLDRFISECWSFQVHSRYEFEEVYPHLGEEKVILWCR